MMKKLFSLFVFSLLISTGVWAQSLSDDQVVEYVKTATEAGKSQKQIMTELVAKGVTRAQAERIKKRYEEQQASEQTMGAVAKNRQRHTEEVTTEISGGNMDLITAEMSNPTEQSTDVAAQLVFGRNIFNSRNLTFAPSQNLPTPVNYKLAAGDEVIIDIWGSSQMTYREYISPEGNINIPNIGPIYLNGMTIQSAEKYLKKELSKIHSGIDGENPTTEMKLTLGQIRTIQVNIMGEVTVPGTYNISSFSNIFHALYRAGGIGKLGSLRNIYLMRNGKKIANVDVYDFILKGKTMDATRLQEGDVIIVPPYEMLVDIQGNVKRPMFYEMKNGETVKTLIDYAGNFTGNAYTKNVRITRQNGREYQIYTVDDIDYSVFKLMDGDVLNVSAMLDRFANRLEIKGAVYRPGVYQFSGQLNTVKLLVEKAEGIMGDAFLGRAVLHREREDLTKEVIQVDLKNILNGTKPDIALQRNDVLYIPSIHDLQDIGTISVFGEVARPGDFPFAENTTLEDIIIQAGGLKESASSVRVDVSRRIKDSKGTQVSNEIGQMFTFALKDGFVIDGEQGFKLQPYDQVFVRKSPAYQEQTNVSINGEILYGGTYALTQKSERLSNLIEKAGGLTPYAYAKGARLIRKINEEERFRMQNVLDMAKQSAEGSDSIDISKLDLGNVYYVGIDLEKALKNPNSDDDIILREGDVLVVPEYNNTVRISGAVMYPNTVSYSSNKSLSYYIEQAGGYGVRAKKNKAYIIYMNGQVKKAKKFSNNVIQPGCEIIVPSKEKNQFKLQNILSIATTSASLATMVASIANILK
ncbi:MAG: SLBB domain-containing protein [Bacteroidaceae bacterium]|nr:SLBB domain-containing protein [Bacteroidaceae bacterium]